MRILQAITSLDIGGAEKLVTELVPLLRRKGHKVDVLAINGFDTNFKITLEKEGIRIISFTRNGSVYNIKFLFKMAKLMRNYDVVHTHITATQLYGAFGSYFCKARMVTTEHATSNRRRGHLLFKLMDKWMYSRYDKIISISEPCDDSLKSYIGTDYPFCIIKNGVNIKKFSDAEPVDLAIGECRKITMVAGFRYEKDQPTLIKALKFLPEEFHVVLVGDGVERINIETLISKESLSNRVHLLGKRGDIPQILKSSDVIVMSSHREGLSLSNIEGMCSGHPFVASDVEGLREVTKGYGLLFPHGDSKTLADIILRLSTDKTFANEVTAKCKERAMQYDIERMVDSYEEVYNSLIQ